MLAPYPKTIAPIRTLRLLFVLRFAQHDLFV